MAGHQIVYSSQSAQAAKWMSAFTKIDHLLAPLVASIPQNDKPNLIVKLYRSRSPEASIHAYVPPVATHVATQ